MGVPFVSGMNKKHVILAEGKVAKIPDAEVSVFYFESKNIVGLPSDKKTLFTNALNEAFGVRGNAIIETVCKNTQETIVKLERAWENTPKGADDLANVIRLIQKNVADTVVDMQKKLLAACKTCAEEARPSAGVVGPIDCQVRVSLIGKVSESAEAKTAVSSLADSAEARSENVDAALKLVSQVEADLKTSASIAAKAVTSLDNADDEATHSAEKMKDFLKNKGLKEATVFKATTLMLARELKEANDHMSSVHAHVWEAQRRLDLVEKALKPLKAPALAKDIKVCETAMDKAEKPLDDWLKAKHFVDNALKSWDGKSPRDYAKLIAALKGVSKENPVKLLKTALEDTAKLATAIEAARVVKT